MKKLLVTAFIAVCILFSSCSYFEIDLPSYDVSDTASGESREPVIKTVYLLKRETTYSQYMVVESYTEYEYDEQHREIKRTVYDRTGKRTSAVWTEYDINGRVTSVTYYDADGLTDYVVDSRYNEDGVLVSEYTYNPDGAITNLLLYTYDELGRKTDTVYSNASGAVLYSVVNTYNSDGTYVSNLDVVSGIKRRAECDANGNILIQTDYDSDGNLNYKTTYVYDESKTNRVSAVTEYADGSWTDFEYFYNEDGAIDYIEYRSMSELVSSIYTYEYDEHGNLVYEGASNAAEVPMSAITREYIAVETEVIIEDEAETESE